MTRKELAQDAYEILKKDFGGEVSEKELWKHIAETDDQSLLDFVVVRFTKVNEPLI